MARVADLFELAMINGANDGKAVLGLLEKGESAFAKIEDEQPKFREYRQHEAAVNKRALDGKTEYVALKEIRAEIAKPKDASSQRVTDRTVALIEVCCARILDELRDPKKRTYRFLSSQKGVLSWDLESTKQAHEDAKGVYATGDVLAESVFGVMDHLLHQYRTMGIQAGSGVGTSLINGDFSRGETPKLARKPGPGSTGATAAPVEAQTAPTEDPPRAVPPAAPAPTHPNAANAPTAAPAAPAVAARDVPARGRPRRAAAAVPTPAPAPAAAAPCVGAFHDLTPNQRISLVEHSRIACDDERRYGAELKKEHDAYWEEKRKRNHEETLRRLIEKATATREHWNKRHTRALTMDDVASALERIPAKGKKLDYLKDQIRIRVQGFGWSDLHVAWSVKNVDKTIEELTAELETILTEEVARGAPTEEPVASMPRKTLKQLGAPIAQLETLRAVVDADEAEFRRRVDRESEEQRERRKHTVEQPGAPPPADASLVGKHIEYLDSVELDGGTWSLHWFSGEIKQVSDGTVPKGGRSRQNWGEGFCYIEFDAQGDDDPTFQWLLLRPNKWNGSTKGCWRLDLDYHGGDAT